MYSNYNGSEWATSPEFDETSEHYFELGKEHGRNGEDSIAHTILMPTWEALYQEGLKFGAQAAESIEPQKCSQCDAWKKFPHTNNTGYCKEFDEVMRHDDPAADLCKVQFWNRANSTRLGQFI